MKFVYFSLFLKSYLDTVSNFNFPSGFKPDVYREVIIVSFVWLMLDTRQSCLREQTLLL
jgi:hypothetical protein